MSRYILSPAAEADIDAIWDYTAEQWSVEQADNYVNQLRNAWTKISPDGREGRPIPKARQGKARQGYRKLSVGSQFHCLQACRR